MGPTCERCPNELIYWVKWDVKIFLKIETIEEYKILKAFALILMNVGTNIKVTSHGWKGFGRHQLMNFQLRKSKTSNFNF